MVNEHSTEKVTPGAEVTMSGKRGVVTAIHERTATADVMWIDAPFGPYPVREVMSDLSSLPPEPKRILMTEPHDGHPVTEECPGCPHESSIPPGEPCAVFAPTPFCIDCPDHEACATGTPCTITRAASSLPPAPQEDR